MSGSRIGMGFLVAAALLISLQPTGAASPASSAADDVAYRAIVNHDWAAAEQQLLAGLQKDPDSSFRRLNLAWVYAQTGRKAEAAALYREILKRDKDRVASLSARDGRSVAQLAERGLLLLNENQVKDALVVDTIGFNGRTFVDNYRTPHTDKLHVAASRPMIRVRSTCRVLPIPQDDAPDF